MNKINVIIFFDEFLPAKGIAAILKELYFEINFSLPQNIDELKSILNNETCDMLFISENIAKQIDNQHFKEVLSRADIVVAGETESFKFIKIHDFFSEKISRNDIYEKLKFYLKKFEEAEQSENNTLSDREKDILKLVAQGFTNKEIAEKLFLSIHTVTTHRKNISNKLGIKSISGLTIYAVLNGIISIENISEQN